MVPVTHKEKMMDSRSKSLLIPATAVTGLAVGIAGYVTDPALVAIGLISLSAIVVGLAQQTLP
jgi:hypothetical protein